MTFVNFLAFSTLLYIVNSANVDKGYLVLNGSLPTKDCYNLPSNSQCPSVNRKVFGFGHNDTYTNDNLKAVDLMMTSLKFFSEVTQTCKDAVREYACTNAFPSCVKDDRQRMGAIITYDMARLQKLCAEVQKVCPLPAQMATIHNCTTIINDFTGFTFCVNAPSVAGDICPKTKYTYLQNYAKYYVTRMKSFNESFNRLAPLLDVSPGCRDEFRDINCDLLRGPICSDDMKLGMYTATQQSCTTTMKRCLPSLIPNLRPYFLKMCTLFPDANNAKIVPLPSVAVEKE